MNQAKPDFEWPAFEPGCWTELNGQQVARSREWYQLMERVVGMRLEGLISKSLFVL